MMEFASCTVTVALREETGVGRSDEAATNRLGGGRRARGNVELGEDVPHVRGHCAVADAEHLGDIALLVVGGAAEASTGRPCGSMSTDRTR